MNLALPVRIGVFLCTGVFFLGLAGGTAGRPAMKEWLGNRLISTDPLPSGISFDAVYIFGGGQEALEPKFAKAADLYVQGRCKRIFILSRPGKTEFNMEYGRNLTNDEWSFLQLRHKGVPSKVVEKIAPGEGFFGTFAEAEEAARVFRKRGYVTVALISSPHHTQRVRETFRHFFHGSNMQVFVFGSTYQRGILELIKEYMKLHLYRLLLI